MKSDCFNLNVNWKYASNTVLTGIMICFSTYIFSQSAIQFAAISTPNKNYNDLRGLGEIHAEKVPNKNLYRYKLIPRGGLTETLNKIKSLGYKDAFVTKYKNKSRSKSNTKYCTSSSNTTNKIKFCIDIPSIFSLQDYVHNDPNFQDGFNSIGYRGSSLFVIIEVFINPMKVEINYEDDFIINPILNTIEIRLKDELSYQESIIEVEKKLFKTKNLIGGYLDYIKSSENTSYICKDYYLYIDKNEFLIKSQIGILRNDENLTLEQINEIKIFKNALDKMVASAIAVN